MRALHTGGDSRRGRGAPSLLAGCRQKRGQPQARRAQPALAMAEAAAGGGVDGPRERPAALQCCKQVAWAPRRHEKSGGRICAQCRDLHCEATLVQRQEGKARMQGTQYTVGVVSGYCYVTTDGVRRRSSARRGQARRAGEQGRSLSEKLEGLLRGRIHGAQEAGAGERTRMLSATAAHPVAVLQAKASCAPREGHPVRGPCAAGTRVDKVTQWKGRKAR